MLIIALKGLSQVWDLAAGPSGPAAISNVFVS